MGASNVLSSTVATCTIMVGLTMPVPRNADDIATRANCSARPGMNHNRYARPCSIVASSAATERKYGSVSTNPIAIEKAPRIAASNRD
jgi:hypothetical protein